MTTQLKDKVQQLQDFYKEENRESAIALTGSTLIYDDLISAEDRDFWNYLCKKDFCRLEKLLTQNIGEGHFIDDSSEEEADGDDVPKKVESESETGDEVLDFLEKKRSHVVKKRNSVNNRYQNDNDEGDEDYDHGSFIESMLNNFNDDKQNEIQKQIREEEEKQEQIKEQEKSKFNDNQFWQESSMENQYDLDELMKDLE